jgi:hypothetical protein
MDADLVSIRDIAAEFGKRKQTIFKVLKRLRILPDLRRSEAGRNQKVAYVTLEEARRIRHELTSRVSIGVAEESPSPDPFETDIGCFYVVQLEPHMDPKRFKVGFASNMSERLQKLRCSAPFAAALRTWPCRVLWERTAIDCVTDGCERLHTEVFRAADVSAVIEKCERFFSLMPSLGK